MTNNKSNLPLQFEQVIDKSFEAFYNKVFNILSDTQIDSNAKKNTILNILINTKSNIINGAETLDAGKYKDEINKSSKKIPPQIKKNIFDLMNQNLSTDELKTELDKQKGKDIQDTKRIYEAIFETVNNKDSQELEVSIKEVTGTPPSPEYLAELKEKFDANSEMTEEELAKFKLTRKDAEKIKIKYKYKVEGKISSGINELDTFLEMIQPGLDLILKTGAKILYEGVMDPLRNVFVGNPELGIKSYFGEWKEKRDNLENDYRFLGLSDKFKPLRNFDSTEDYAAGVFNSRIIQKINENRENAHNNYLYQEESLKKTVKNFLTTTDFKDATVNKMAQDFASKDFSLNDLMQDRKILNLLPEEMPEQIYQLAMDKRSQQPEMLKGDVNAFDKTFDWNETKLALEDIIRETIEKHRKTDDKGNKINQPTNDGKKDLNAILHLVDLFNKENSDEFLSAFHGILSHYISGYNKSAGKGSDNCVENTSYVGNVETEEKQKQQYLQDLIDTCGGIDKLKDTINTK